MIGAIEEAAERKAHAEQTEDVKPVPDLVDVEGVENAEEDALEDEEDQQRSFFVSKRQTRGPSSSFGTGRGHRPHSIRPSRPPPAASTRGFCRAMTKPAAHLPLTAPRTAPSTDSVRRSSG